MEHSAALESPSQEQTLSIGIVDDNDAYAQEVSICLQRLGILTRITRKLSKMVELMPQSSPDILVIALRTPEALDLKLLRAIAQNHPETSMICLLSPDLTSYDELLRQAGVQRVAPMQLKPRQLADMLMTMTELRSLEDQNYRLRQMLDGRSSYENLIGGSLPMRAMYRLLDQIARTDSPVLITGEEGTEGVDVARAIHQKSERTIQPVIVVDCSKCKDDADASAVFGARGTGAYASGPCPRTSAFAKAGKGTVVLNRIDSLHLDAQKRLLDFMHRPFFQNETAGTPHPLSRIIATSGPDLLSKVEAGKFMRELFYRLNILQVRVPPLRERREDIPMLAQYYLRFAESGKNGRQPGRGIAFSSQALLRLFQHDWKGNLSELKDLVDNLAEKSDGVEIDAVDLPGPIQQMGEAPVELVKPLPYTDRSLKEAKRHFETEYFKELLKKTGGNMTMASRLSRVGRPYLYKKIREYDIDPETFR